MQFVQYNICGFSKVSRR